MVRHRLQRHPREDGSAGRLVAAAIGIDHVGGHVVLVAERSVPAGLGVGASPPAAPPAVVNIVGARARAKIAGARFGSFTSHAHALSSAVVEHISARLSGASLRHG